MTVPPALPVRTRVGRSFDLDQAFGSHFLFRSACNCAGRQASAESNAWREGVERLLKFAIAATTLTGLMVVEKAHAVDLSGAWATNADQCSQVFTRKGPSCRHQGAECDRSRADYWIKPA